MDKSKIARKIEWRTYSFVRPNVFEAINNEIRDSILILSLTLSLSLSQAALHTAHKQTANTMGSRGRKGETGEREKEREYERERERGSKPSL